MDKANLSAIRETFGKVVYTHKTHEKAAEICVSKTKWFKGINVFLLALTTGGALGSVLKGETFIIATSILSTTALFFIIYQLSLNPEYDALLHKRTAIKLWYIREQYQNLIADIVSERLSPDRIAEKRDLLLSDLNKILQDAPQTDSKAYSKARRALKLKKEMTFSDKEIDSFLPEELRLGKTR
jgi:hypothetical protein